MNAWQIKEEITNCVKLDDGTVVGGVSGEVLDEQAIDQLNLSFEEKVRNIALWAKQLDLDLAQYDMVIKGYQDRRKRDERLRDNLKDYLRRLLDGKKRKTIDYEISFRKSTAVEITDFGKVDKRFLVIPPPKVSLKAVKEALKAGEDVSGCQLVERTNTIIK